MMMMMIDDDDDDDRRISLMIDDDDEKILEKVRKSIKISENRSKSCLNLIG